MPKNTDDMEEIIRILVCLLDHKKVDFEYIKLKLRENHFCIDCNQHYKRCICGTENTTTESCETSSISSNDDYESSEVSDN